MIEVATVLASTFGEMRHRHSDARAFEIDEIGPIERRADCPNMVCVWALLVEAV
jgi:hypothetical protein